MDYFSRSQAMRKRIESEGPLMEKIAYHFNTLHIQRDSANSRMRFYTIASEYYGLHVEIGHALWADILGSNLHALRTQERYARILEDVSEFCVGVINDRADAINRASGLLIGLNPKIEVMLLPTLNQIFQLEAPERLRYLDTGACINLR